MQKERRAREEKEQEEEIVRYQKARDLKEQEAQIEAQRIKDEKEREI